MRLPTSKETIVLFILVACLMGYILWLTGGALHVGTAAVRLTDYIRDTVSSSDTNITSPSKRARSNATAPRVICMIFTTPDQWPKRGVAVRNTWSRHCHRRRFFYSQLAPNKSAQIEKDPDALALNVSEGRGYLTAKTMNALAYSYRNFGDDTDWYMKADDDSYVIWANLIKYLRRLDPEEATYHGHWIVGTMGHLPRGYNSGGGVYMLSRGSTRKVMTEGVRKFPGNCKMSERSAWEDVDTGDCLRALGVYPTDTRDSQQRLRFDSQSPLTFLKGILGEGSNHLAPYFSAKYNGMVFGNYEKGERMLSDESISFHYVSPAEMIFIDSLIS